MVEDDFDAGGIVELVKVANGSGEGAHDGGGVVFEQLDGEVDGGGGDFGLVALDVDEDINAGHLGRDFGNAVGAAGAVGAGKLDVATE